MSDIKLYVNIHGVTIKQFILNSATPVDLKSISSSNIDYDESDALLDCDFDDYEPHMLSNRSYFGNNSDNDVINEDTVAADIDVDTASLV